VKYLDSCRDYFFPSTYYSACANGILKFSALMHYRVTFYLPTHLTAFYLLLLWERDREVGLQQRVCVRNFGLRCRVIFLDFQISIYTGIASCATIECNSR